MDGEESFERKELRSEEAAGYLRGAVWISGLKRGARSTAAAFLAPFREGVVGEKGDVGVWGLWEAR